MRMTRIGKNIAVIIAVLTIAAGCGKTEIGTQSTANPAEQNIIHEPKDISFAIQPSEQKDGWTTYKQGAVAQVKGAGLARVEIKYLPTGTGAAEEYPGGISLGAATSLSSQRNTWALQLPPNLLTSNFWYEATSIDGKLIKGQDLGSVASMEK